LIPPCNNSGAAGIFFNFLFYHPIFSISRASVEKLAKIWEIYEEAARAGYHTASPVINPASQTRKSVSEASFPAM